MRMLFFFFVATLVALSASQVTVDLSNKDFEIFTTSGTSNEVEFWQVSVRNKATLERAQFKLLVEKVSSGTFWLLPGAYLQVESGNSTSVFVAPTISFDSVLELNGTAPFADLKTLPENEVFVSTNRIFSYPDSSLLATRLSDGVRVDIRSNPASDFRLVISAYYFTANTTFQGRLVTPMDLKMDYRIERATPSASRLGLATGWWGTPNGLGTLPTPGKDTALDKVWSMIGSAGTGGEPITGRVDWVCARNASAETASGTQVAEVLVRTRPATGTAGSQNFQFWGFYDVAQATSVTWDPAASVLVSVSSEEGGGSNVGLIVGATVGAIVGGVLIAVMIACITSSQKRKREKAFHEREMLVT